MRKKKMNEKEMDKIILKSRIKYRDTTDKAREEYHINTTKEYNKWLDFKEPYDIIMIKKFKEAKKEHDDAISKIPDGELKEKCLLKRR